jgi:hypothetical protein
MDGIHHYNYSKNSHTVSTKAIHNVVIPMPTTTLYVETQMRSFFGPHNPTYVY